MAPSQTFSLRDALLALVVVCVWGTNFVVIRIGLDTLPPLFFASLRFFFVLFPAIFFLPKPKVPWSNLALYGISIGLLQFGMLFIAMNGLISPGLASLVIQMQAFITIGFAFLRASRRPAAKRHNEKPNSKQLLGLALGLSGMAVIAAHNGQGATIKGLALVLGAALGWALGNQTSREAGDVNMLAYVVWASPFSLPPLLILSFALEGWSAIHAGLDHSDWVIFAVVIWQSLANTLFGYSCWAWLLARHPAATISPIALLIPVIGLSASALFLGEAMQGWKIIAMLLILAGLALNLLFRGKMLLTAPSARAKL